MKKWWIGMRKINNIKSDEHIIIREHFLNIKSDERQKKIQNWYTIKEIMYLKKIKTKFMISILIIKVIINEFFLK